MPIVTIQVTREGTTPGAASLTAEEKAALIKGSSELLLNVLGKPLDSTFRRDRGSGYRQLGLGWLARVGIPAPPRSPDRIIRALLARRRTT